VSPIRSNVNTFVARLCLTERGRVIAVNMLESCEDGAGLVAAEFLSSFLKDCAELDDPALSPLDCVRIVADVAAGDGPARRSYLRHGRQQVQPDGGYVMTNVLKTGSFHHFLLSPDYKAASGLSEVLPLEPTLDEPEEYTDVLRSILSRSDWSKPGATLGRPYPASSNCWLSTNRFGADGGGPDYADDPATQARDERGLIDYEDGDWVLEVRIPEAALHALPTLEVARPVFCDLGNSRFRVQQDTAKATAFAQAGWGATVHLGKLREAPAADVTGVAERVTAPIPVHAINGAEFRLLGRVSTQSHKPPESGTADRAFHDWVLGARSADELQQRLLELANGAQR